MSATSELNRSGIEALLADEARTRCLDLSMVRSVMALRRRHTMDGNRRRLFAALDNLFSNGVANFADAEVEPTPEQGPIRLRRLQLRNWKVFEALDLSLPEFEAERPVVLIGGKNGYGKTSLLEGLLYGLFGREAVTSLARPEVATRASAYRQTVQRAFSHRAKARGEGVMSVRSEWETTDGPFVVERRWFFDDAGILVPEDETLTLWSGPDGTVLPCPVEVDPGEYLQQALYRRLLSPSLAAFVFFDGEQVQRFAEVGFSTQVRSALESALGLSVWRGAVNDLRDYARDRGRGGSRGDGRDEAEATLARLDQEIGRVKSTLSALGDRRAAPETARDALLGEIAALEGGDYAGLHVLLERQQANRAEQARVRHELAAAATSALPSLLTSSLRAALGHTLAAEAVPSAADAVLFRDEDALELLVHTLRYEDQALAPLVESLVRTAWARLRGDGSQEMTTRRHSYLPYRVLPTLRDAAERPADLSPLEAAADRVRRLEAEAQEVAEALSVQKRRDERLGVARRELQAVRQEIGLLDAEARLIETRLAQLEAERVPLAAADDVARDTDESAARARAALAVAYAIEEVIAGVLPRCFGAVGLAVTEAYRALAHKSLVSRIEVADDGAVHLFDERGEDLRALDASAGESQVFAMALMAAIGSLAGQRLPALIDTPLGRLDPEHRRRILSFFTSRQRQTLLLSQPDEVSGAYLAMIEGRIAARFRLEHASPDGGPGGSTATPGYFEDLAA